MARARASLFTEVIYLSAKSCVVVGQAGSAESTNGTGLSGFWNSLSRTGRWCLPMAKAGSPLP
jgi:hypothetical protein